MDEERGSRASLLHRYRSRRRVVSVVVAGVTRREEQACQSNRPTARKVGQQAVRRLPRTCTDDQSNPPRQRKTTFTLAASQTAIVVPVWVYRHPFFPP